MNRDEKTPPLYHLNGSLNEDVIPIDRFVVTEFIVVYEGNVSTLNLLKTGPPQLAKGCIVNVNCQSAWSGPWLEIKSEEFHLRMFR